MSKKSLAVQPAILRGLAFVGAACAGAWLGFGSCGGYVWHAYVGYGVLTLAVLSLITPGRGSATKRAALAGLVAASFFVAKAAGFAAYLGPNTSGEYLRQIAATFSSGLC
ncbi:MULTISPECIES: hypothetical protein [unclassified Lysobacter]|uniref:hypothetical protein n=1 Tax=unclassified Lysobacter TaxID=2635362 RepID=UPI001C230C37|nr:hypothetical protein [Lysobacter sp. MMG2]MBU8978263.1 hypothetical protein [Lysobacter sp. MMG2]